MNPLIQVKKAIPVFLVALACFGLSPMVQALLPPPPPDGGYPGFNTAEGDDALFSLTIGNSNTAIGAAALFGDRTGSRNTAVGVLALSSNTDGGENVAVGVNALFNNTTGHSNVATGDSALFSNRTGRFNTANGDFALGSNSTGVFNTATGANALFSNTIGTDNVANGVSALFSNTTGSENTATGREALFTNTTGNHNTANGVGALRNNRGGAENTAMGGRALFMNTSGNFNTAVGVNALFNTTGLNNVAIGHQAGINVTTGSNNIDIGAFGGSGDSQTIRIGRPDLQNSTFIAGIFGAPMSGNVVVVNSSGKLGVVPSSARFKDNIEPMDKASEAILALEPVTFRYKGEIDSEHIRQFGLVAEEVQKVSPDLVVRDKEGKPYSVRYEAVNAMLLNEFLKEHRTVQELKSNAAKQEATIARQQKQIEVLTAGLQKVSAQLEVSKPAPQTVLNSQ
jgi:hypothetical protein